MESSIQFVEKLAQAVALKRTELNTKMLPNMQKNYTQLCSIIKILQTNLLKKGLIHDDPYKYDSRMTEIKVPSCDPFPEQERAAVIGSRLAQYQTMVDFLINSYQFHCNYLTHKRISSMISLNKTFQWSSLNEPSSNPNSKALSEIIQSVQDSSDTLTGGLFRDSLSHLAKLDSEINTAITSITHLYREEYKLLARKNMSDDLKITAQEATFSDKLLKAIKKHFSSSSEKIPFYHDLVLEMLKEDYSEASEQLQNQVIQSLAIQEKKENLVKQETDIRLVLSTGIKIVSTTGNQFSTCLEKIYANQEIINKAHSTFISKFIESIKSLLNIPEKKHEVVIILKSEKHYTQKKQVVVLEDFHEELEKKVRVFKNIASSNPHIQKRMRAMTTDQLLSLLNKYISTCRQYLQTLNGLDEYYENVDPLLRAKMKGIKIELTTIQNSVLKANQCRAEYLLSVEKQEQMTKLGIINE